MHLRLPAIFAHGVILICTARLAGWGAHQLLGTPSTALQEVAEGMLLLWVARILASLGAGLLGDEDLQP